MPGQGTAYSVQPNGTALRNVTAEPSGIRQVQATDPSGKPLPPNIASMPSIQEELEVIEDRSQLIIARRPIVRMAIANPGVAEVAQFSPMEMSIIGLQRGQTNMTFWFEGDPNPLIYLVKVISDPSLEDQRRIDYGKLEKKIAILFPNSKVYLIPLSRKIIVKGQAKDAEEAAQILSIIRGEFITQDGNLGGPQPDDRRGGGSSYFDDLGLNNSLYSSFIVNMLEIPGEHQVMLHVRVAELNRSELRRLGVNLDVLLNDGRQILSAAAGGIPASLTGIFENGEISVLVNWLASNGTAKVLSEPTLTVLSGHTASFQSGAEFAVPTILGVGGVSGQTTEFRATGSSLVVTPTVLDHDLVRMVIAPEFSVINEGASVGGVPGVDSRRVQTTVQLREGQTLALAGLISHQTHTEVTRIPFLGELPWIGAKLFNAKEATQDESELLILVTPEIVRPMEPDEVPPVPGHEVTVPSDQELYGYAMTEGAPDQGVYQLAPYGHGAGQGMEVGYRPHNPPPMMPGYTPQPSAGAGFGYAQQPMMGQSTRYGMQPTPAPGMQQMPSYSPTPAPNPGMQRAVPAPTNQAPLSPIPDPSVRSTYPTPGSLGRATPVGFFQTAPVAPLNKLGHWPWSLRNAQQRATQPNVPTGVIQGNSPQQYATPNYSVPSGQRYR